MGRVRDQSVPTRGPFRRLGRAVLGVIVVSLVAPVAGPVAAGSAAVAPPAARENASFVYQPLTAETLPKAGQPRIMVVTHVDAAASARAASVRSYKYVQLNWFPGVGDWNMTTAEQRAPWRLCGPSGQPAGDGSSSSRMLWYADFNERGYVDAMLAYARHLKSRGFQGVFVDVSGRALIGPHRRTRSTCTESPVTPGLRSSDAYVRLLQRIRNLGLRVAINFPSLFADPLLRPSSVGQSTVNDLRPLVDWVLHENAASVDQLPFNQLIERLRFDAKLSGGKVVEMAKSQRVPGAPEKSAHERSVWALAKLSGQPVVLNTGDDRCVGVGSVPGGCLRMGLAPDLVDLQLGSPLDPEPLGADCNRQTGNCGWYRRFQLGFVVYNGGNDPRVRRMPIPVTADGSCRLVHEVRGGNITGGRCVRQLTITVPPNQGRIFTLTR